MYELSVDFPGKGHQASGQALGSNSISYLVLLLILCQQSHQTSRFKEGRSLLRIGSQGLSSLRHSVKRGGSIKEKYAQVTGVL